METRYFYLIVILLLFSNPGDSQVAINNSAMPPNISSVLDLTATDKGLLIPRMTKVQRDGIMLPANSLIIYQTDNSPGYYFNIGTPVLPKWKLLSSTDTPSLSSGYKIPIDTIPFVINIPGSYIVTKNLSGLQGIDINSSNVSIDLNFNTISGLVSNNDSGIFVSGAQSQITVYNGNIVNWADEGINAEYTTSSRFFNIIIKSNGNDGIFTGKNAVISDCIALNNGLDGIDTDSASTIQHCLASYNSNEGIDAGVGANISNNTTSLNGSHGIKAGTNSILQANNSYKNTGNGIYSGANNNLFDNVSAENTLSGFYLFNASKSYNNNARSNTNHGFECGQDIDIKNCSSDSNLGSGFFSAFNGGKLEENLSSDNNIGYNISGTAWLLIKNSASGNTVQDFTIGPGNMLATILTSATLNSNTNPFVNISY
ncbi:MAG: right-handed parallel beta-helix repeat-containing protein [Saprospiraceae bacterium]|nr:right-handed parallel beta-helix repeat-containing protein [Saprospiraceae bacterium]